MSRPNIEAELRSRVGMPTEGLMVDFLTAVQWCEEYYTAGHAMGYELAEDEFYNGGIAT